MPEAFACLPGHIIKRRHVRSAAHRYPRPTWRAALTAPGVASSAKCAPPPGPGGAMSRSWTSKSRHRAAGQLRHARHADVDKARSLPRCSAPSLTRPEFRARRFNDTPGSRPRPRRAQTRRGGDSRRKSPPRIYPTVGTAALDKSPCPDLKGPQCHPCCRTGAPKLLAQPRQKPRRRTDHSCPHPRTPSTPT